MENNKDTLPRYTDPPSREGLEMQIATRLTALAVLTMNEDEKIVILNEVKNLVLPQLTLMNSLARSFGALRMTRLSQIVTRLTSLAALTMNEDEKIVILN